MLRLLLDNGGDPNVATLNGLTPLSGAALRGDVDAMRLLIDKGAPIDAKNGAGATALMAAATNGSPAAVQLLARARAPTPHVRSKLGETPLGNAAGAGNAATVKTAARSRRRRERRNSRGYSPLMLAAGSDAMNADIVKLLIAKGADTSFSADYDETAHILAGRRGDTDGDTAARRRREEATSNRAGTVASQKVAAVRSPYTAIESALAVARKTEPQLHSHRRLQFVSRAGSRVGRRGHRARQWHSGAA